jgi:predicted ferric reductase
MLIKLLVSNFFAECASLIEKNMENITPWAWYISRAAGLMGFIFLWLTIFLGLSIRNPMLKKIIQPVYSFNLHCFVAALAFFWALVHGTSFLFHGDFSLSLKEIAIPFYSKTDLVNTNYLVLGILAFHMIVIMTITSYLRSHLKHWLWRVLHFLNPLAFVFVVVHGYMIGTDMKNIYVGRAFLISAGILVIIYLSNLGAVIWNKYKAPSAEEILKHN